MLKNYFKTALRNLRRNKGYAFINITGLAIGVAACILIFLVIQYETSFDNFHNNRDHIYRIGTAFHGPDGVRYTRGICFPAGKQLKLDYPQVEKVASIFGQQGDQVTVMDETGKPTKKKFNEKGLFFIEPAFFEIFNFPFLAGDPKTALSEPKTAVITQATAEKYFGDWHKAIGRTIKYTDHTVCKVTGVLKNIPVNSDFPIDVALSFKTSEYDSSQDWVSTRSDLNIFTVLPPDMTRAQFNNNLVALTKKHKPAEYAKDVFVSQPLSDIHFNKDFGNYSGHTFSRELITALSLIGLFLLIIACINFINLATAQAVNRAKEVGVRKVLGSRKKDLIFQFLSETFIITVFSVLLALVISTSVLPLLNKLLETNVIMKITTPMLLFLAGVIVLVTVLSGFYPAIVLSGFNPITALKSKLTTKAVGGLSLRRGLVVLQFVIAQALIMGTIIIVSQMNYFRNASMGFNKDAVIYVTMPNDSISVTKHQTLKTLLLQNPGVQNVSYSTFTISDNGHWNSDFRFDNRPNKTDFGADFKWADADVFKTFNLQVVAGRPYQQTDTIRELVVNETMVKRLGLKNPQDIINKKMNFWDGAIFAPVVGVVKDFNGGSLAGAIQPTVMGSWNAAYGTVAIKIHPQQLKQTLAAIEKTWTDLYPDFVYQYQFLDDKIAGFYKQEDQLSQLYKIFAGIAIFISCLGLYGLISFMAVQRTKEVGIRKVLGASVGNIVYIFSKEFTLLICIAFLVAAPLAYYFMHKWLTNFTFRITIGAGVFIITILASVIIAWVTVGYRAVRAALANPVKSLRSE